MTAPLLDFDDEFEDDQPNPFSRLHELRQATSELSKWSAELLDQAISIRIRASLGQPEGLEHTFDTLRGLLDQAPTIGRGEGLSRTPHG